MTTKYVFFFGERQPHSVSPHGVSAAVGALSAHWPQLTPLCATAIYRKYLTEVSRNLTAMLKSEMLLPVRMGEKTKEIFIN